jgi:hypothetical protein
MPDPALFHCPKCGKFFVRAKHPLIARGILYEDSPAKETIVARALRGDHIAEWACRKCKREIEIERWGNVTPPGRG